MSIPASPSRRSLSRRYVNIVINLTLLVLVVVSFITGWIASLLGLTEFGLHKYSSVALLLVASAHLVLHWRSLKTQLRNIGTNRYDRRDPAQYDRRNPALPDRRAPRRELGVTPMTRAGDVSDRRAEPVEEPVVVRSAALPSAEHLFVHVEHRRGL